MEVIVIRNWKDCEDKLSDEILTQSFNVYCRVSTTSQIDNTSLDSQSESGIDYCKRNFEGDFKYIINWREEGKSGDDLIGDGDNISDIVRRELLSLIMRKWDEGIIKNFWVSDLSRLSRNTETSTLIKSRLFKNGVDFYLENTKYNFDDKMEKMIFSILSTFNEFENTVRFEKGLMGKRRNLDVGKWWGGKISFGLKNNGEGKLIEDDEITNKGYSNYYWVKKIFDWYNNGDSTIKICDRLEKIGVKTNRGNTNWNSGSVRLILSNTIYIGYKEYSVKGIKNKSKEYCKSKGMLFTHTFKCKPIIDKEDWDKVRKGCWRIDEILINQIKINTYLKIYCIV